MRHVGVPRLADEPGTTAWGVLADGLEHVRLIIDKRFQVQGFRDQGIFYEDVTNRICDDLVRLMEPRWLVVRTRWRARGGIRSCITATHGPVPERMGDRR